MNKPVIGVTPLWDTDKQSLWMLPGYMDGIRASGGIPVVLPLDSDKKAIKQLAHGYDGFLFTGGQDVSPALYGEEPLPACGEPCAMRDAMEPLLFEEAVLQLDKPGLGICRGLQLFNVLLGGSLYQDLDTQHESHIKHRQMPPYHKPAHKALLPYGSPLRQTLEVT